MILIWNFVLTEIFKFVKVSFFILDSRVDNTSPKGCADAAWGKNDSFNERGYASGRNYIYNANVFTLQPKEASSKKW